jgi:hypothetical protein
MMGIFDLYHPVRDQIESGDLIEWHTTGSTVSSLIRRFSGQDVNHSSLVIVLPDRYRVDHRDMVIIVEAVAGGIKQSYLSNVIARHHGKAYWYKLRATDEQRLTMSRWAFHEELAHKGYDYGSIFKQMFGRVSAEATKYFCSEFYQIAMKRAELISTDMAALRPGEFSKLGLHEPAIKIGDW